MNPTDRMTAAHDRLVAAVEQLTTGDDWRRFLDTARRFRSYSPNNQLLIFAQRPDATRVAGYRTWQSLGRHVRRGEHGIAILAPCTYRTHDADDDRDDEPGHVFRGFTIVHVFDVTQTDGDPLPEPPVHLLDGADPTQLGRRLATLIECHGYTYTVGPMPTGHEEANGVTDHATRTVIVRADLGPAQQAKTTAHELAHILLHGPHAGPRPARAVCEIEAESVAYLVCGDRGLATDAYSFGYLAAWAEGNPAAVHATAQRVTACAARILEHLDTITAAA